MEKESSVVEEIMAIYDRLSPEGREKFLREFARLEEEEKQPDQRRFLQGA